MRHIKHGTSVGHETKSFERSKAILVLRVLDPIDVLSRTLFT
jgi:hypothetical protein